MRPHRLSIEAMGPFAHEVVVPFDEVGRDGLFLIHGPTGAGKTTLLDGLCFALYGEIPGARSDRGLRSDHASPDAAPRVTLEFSSQGGRYRISRQAHHESPKRRGNGTTTRGPTAVLERLDRPMPALTKLGEVRDEVERLVGLSARQFQQVILLPQGRFERVLQGRPEEREELLGALFPTGGFQAMATWLSDEARQHRERATKVRAQLASTADEARRAAGRALSDDAGPEIGAHLFDPELAGSTSPDQDQLDRLVTRAQAAVSAAARQRAIAREIAQAARIRREEATAQARSWDQRRSGQRELDQLVERAAGIERTREVLIRAEAAEVLRPSIEAQAAAGLGAQTTERGLASARESVRAAAAATTWLGPAQSSVAALLGEGEPDVETGRPHADPGLVSSARAGIASARAELDGLAEAATEIRQAEAGEAAAENEAEEQATRVRRSAERLAAAETAEAVAGEALAAAEAARAREPGAQAEARAAAARADAVEALVRLGPRRLAAREAAVLARTEANEAWTHHLDLWNTYLDDRAGELADQLEPGSPCRVCGSCEHPAPAELRDGAVDRAAVEAAGLAQESAAQAAEVAAGHVEELDRQAAALEASAGSGPHDLGEARRQAREAEAEARSIAETASTAPAHRNARDKAAEAIVVHRSAAKEAAENEVAARERGAGLRERATTIQVRLERSLGPGVDPATAAGPLDRLDSALDGLGRAQENVRRAAATEAEARRRLEADLARAPFTDVEEATAALLAPEQRSDRVREVSGHDEARARVEARLAAPELANLPEARPADGPARAEAETAEQAEELAIRREATAAEGAAVLSGLVERHRRLAAELIPLERAAATHEAVAARCAGRAAPKVSLQRWVLATYLAGICEHANVRLAAMTGGRYRLAVARDVLHAGHKAGLDLRVHDAHTGTERPVTSLSGGETFQASLALALGVADSVEARTGGVRLDALFVDEGFGTLDADTLELAMDELDGLRSGGRMVGVISHVAGLRERIHQGIEVTPSRRGSSLRVGAVANA